MTSVCYDEYKIFIKVMEDQFMIKIYLTVYHFERVMYNRFRGLWFVFIHFFHCLFACLFLSDTFERGMGGGGGGEGLEGNRGRGLGTDHVLWNVYNAEMYITVTSVSLCLLVTFPHQNKDAPNVNGHAEGLSLQGMTVHAAQGLPAANPADGSGEPAQKPRRVSGSLVDWLLLKG